MILGGNQNVVIVFFRYLLIGVILYVLSTFLLAYLFNVNGIENFQETERGLWFSKINQFLQAIFVFVYPALMFNKFCKTKLTIPMYDFRPIGVVLVFYLLTIGFFIIPVLHFSNDWFKAIFTSEVFSSWHEFLETNRQAYNNSVSRMLNDKSIIGLGSTFLIMVLLASVSEELFFRGVVQKLFIVKVQNPYWGIVLTSILFSVFHFQFLVFMPRFLLGMVFGLVFYWSNNIWYPIIAHFINNLIAFLVFVFANPEINKESPEMSFHIILLSFLICLFNLHLFKKHFNMNKV